MTVMLHIVGSIIAGYLLFLIYMSISTHIAIRRERRRRTERQLHRASIERKRQQFVSDWWARWEREHRR